MKKKYGKVHFFGDNIDTDVIIPARYLNLTAPELLAAHCMEDIDADFIKKVKKGDVIVAGKNFGCGSSREHAPKAIKASGVELVIAKSFSRIFYRNAINTGLAIVECVGAAEIKENDEISADLEKGVIYDETTGKSYKTAPFPPYLKEIMEAGGLLEMLVGKEEKL